MPDSFVSDMNMAEATRVTEADIRGKATGWVYSGAMRYLSPAKNSSPVKHCVYTVRSAVWIYA
jgi:hypothetical protein